ncbi:MAG: 6-phosphofructokinase, partial [Elusimicrobia bacterium]|nr:6-phosphofructokinase [Elusimicrobiota bacterium]
LGIAKAAGTTLAVIPEEFEDGVPVQRVCDTIEGSIIKRLSHGRDYGVVMIAEGMAEKLSKSDLETLGNIQRDEHGHLKLADIGFAEFLKRQVEQSLKSRGITIPITDKNIGYELRCAPPVPYDMEYTRDLGYAAIKFLLEGGSGATVASWGGKAVSIPFSDIIDSGTGRPRPHGVDIHSNSYEVALRYMIRLRKDDFK